MLKAKELVRTNVMLDKEVLKAIDEFAEKMAEDRSTVIRHLIKKAITGEKIDQAVKKFQEGASFRKAAEIAGLDYWDFQMELDKRGIPISTSIPFGKRRMRQ